MPQLTYSLFQPPGQEGMVASADTVLRHGAVGTYRECVNSLPGYLPYGRFVVAKPGGKQGELQLPTATGATQPVLGISYIMPVYEKGLNDESGIPSGRPMGYVYEGQVWMRTESAVTADAPVFCRFAAGAGGTQLGAARGDADAGTASEVTRAKFTRAAAAGELVPVRVDIPLV